MMSGARCEPCLFQGLIHTFTFYFLLPPVCGSCRTAEDIVEPVVSPVMLLCQAARQSFTVPRMEDLQPFFGSSHLGDGSSGWGVGKGEGLGHIRRQVAAMNQNGSLPSLLSRLQRWVRFQYALVILEEFLLKKLIWYFLELR